MGGWKLWTGGAIVAIAAGGRFMFPEYGEFWDLLLKIGGMLGLVGVGHKIEKAVR